MNGWIEAARSVGVLDVAKALGHDARKSGAAWSVYGCPVCDADTRHTKSGDKRGALLVTSDGFGWRCIQCDAAGDAVTLAALELTGDELKGNPRWAEVRAWFADTFPTVRYVVELDDKAWRDGLNSEAAKEVERRREKLRAERAQKEAEQREVDKRAADENAKRAQATWAECVPVVDVPEVADYLASRGIDPAKVAAQSLAKALPEKASTKTGAYWVNTGNRLVVPLFDLRGEVRSLVGRLPRSPENDNEKKSLAMMGSRSGLMFANTRALMVFSAGTWPPDTRKDVYVREGEVDYLRTATRPGAEGVPVVGIVQGSWTQAHADCIPAGATVYVYTDNDKDGDRYSESITKTLAGRVKRGDLIAKRARPQSDPTAPKAQATP